LVKTDDDLLAVRLELAVGDVEVGHVEHALGLVLDHGPGPVDTGDGDGELSRPERAALFEAAKVHFIERFDGADDGRLTGAEREAAEATRADATRERAKTGHDGNIGRTQDARDRGTHGNNRNVGKPKQPSPRKSVGGGKGGSRGGLNGEKSRVSCAGRR
jgi:hypothetical protein